MITPRSSRVVAEIRRVVLAGETASLTDAQLLGRFLDHHDESAFAALVHRHGPMVFGVCRRVLHNYQDAEDAFQATFLVLLRRAAQVWPRARVGNWLYGVAFQTARKARVRVARQRQRETHMADPPEPAMPERETWQDVRPVLDQELSRLPDRYRAPVLLCDVEGQTRKEAARQLGLPEGTLSSRLARGRALLARRLTRRGVALSGATLATLTARQAEAVCVPAALACRTAGAGVIPEQVMTLTREVLKAMAWSRIKGAALLLLVVGLAVGLAGLGMGRLDTPMRAAEPGQSPNRREAERPRPDAELLQGTWKVLLLLEEGRKPEDDSGMKGDWTFKEGTVRIRLQPGGGEARKTDFYRYRLDTTTRPKRMDLVPWEKDFEDREEVHRGVYTLEGNVLRVCLAGPRAVRPAAVESREGSGTVLVVLRKEGIAKKVVPEAGAAFERLQARYAARFQGDEKDLARIQREWVRELAEFVRTYPRAEETPEALLQLGMTSEFLCDETAARAWYERLNQDFPESPQAGKARGARDRLTLEGKPFRLTTRRLRDGTPFDFRELHGKLVVVYYWASWNQQSRDDFVRLQQLLARYGERGLELVCVNLDNSREEAREFRRRSEAPGIHLFEAGGLDSPPATRYGILVLPSLFLVGRDGTVISRSVQLGDLEGEIARRVK